MAESNEGNWFGSWINAAKDKIKNSEVLEYVKKDLEEFGSAVKKEASNVMTSTGTVLEKTLKLDSPDSTVSSMKRSFSTFLGQMNTVLNPSPDDSDTEAIMVIEGSETVTLNKFQKALYELQKDDKTYTTDPAASLRKQYECWLEIIDDQLSEDRINKHLQSSALLQTKYELLVPTQVSEEMFWKRYMFKKALLEDTIAHDDAMQKRDLKEKKLTEECVKWEQEDFAKDIELTEEEQTKLLEQYENETRKQQNMSPPKAKKKSSKKVTENVEAKTSPDSKNIKDGKTSLNNSSSNSSIDEEWEKINNDDQS